MKNFFRSVKFKIALTILAFLLLGVFMAGISGSGTSPLSKGLSYVFQPLNSAALSLKEKLTDFRAGFRSSSRYLDEIASLREDIETLKEEIVDYEKIRHKLSAYEAFLEIKGENPDFTFVPAGVLMRDSTDIYLSFTINKGTSDGVNVGDPVIYGKNLLGVVREITPATATVYSIFHPDVSVSAYEIRTREDCYTEAENDLTKDGCIKISGLTPSTPVVTGGIVCTSGIGGIYPRDLIIGTVSRVVNSESDISAYALVTPEVDVSAMVDVFVITDFDGKAQ